MGRVVQIGCRQQQQYVKTCLSCWTPLCLGSIYTYQLLAFASYVLNLCPFSLSPHQLMDQLLLGRCLVLIS